MVAEGVETAGQCAVLVEMQCDLMQGFWFSRLVLAQTLAAMLASAWVVVFVSGRICRRRQLSAANLWRCCTIPALSQERCAECCWRF